MKDRTRATLIELRWPLVALLLALILGAVIVVSTAYLEERKQVESNLAKNRLRAAELALNNVRRQETDLKTYRESFEALAARGFTGEEQRLNWVEYIGEMSGQGLMQAANYEIASQGIAAAPAGIAGNSIDVMTSAIRLQMSFLHDGDLLRALDAVATSTAGFYRTERCAFKRSESALSLNSRENLLADCRLQWITTRPRATPG